MGSKPRDPDLKAKIIDLRAKGLSFPKIAVATGFSRGHILRLADHLRANGDLPHARADKAGPKPPQALCTTPPPAPEMSSPEPAPRARTRASAVQMPPGALYRAVLPCGALSPSVSIVPEARDRGRFDWRMAKALASPRGGSPAGQCADAGQPSTPKRMGRT